MREEYVFKNNILLWDVSCYYNEHVIVATIDVIYKVKKESVKKMNRKKNNNQIKNWFQEKLLKRIRNLQVRMWGWRR